MVMETVNAEDTLYLCNFRVSVDGDWLCLKELADEHSALSEINMPAYTINDQSHAFFSPNFGVRPHLMPKNLKRNTGLNSQNGGTHLNVSSEQKLLTKSAPSSPSVPENQDSIGMLESLLPPSLFAPYAPMCYDRDPVSIERSNLVNICKLVVKELIESSLKYGRMLDSDSIPLQHFFIVLEHVLRHGLKPKRGILGPKKELWDLFQLVEKWTYEAADITSSVRDLPTVSSHTGRARAWMRLALMQKKLPDYFRLLIERRESALVDFFEPGSLMLSDEAIVIMGLLVGLNVIDCNLCVKEEDLDSQMGVIDFSLYLRTPMPDLTSLEELPDIANRNSDMTAVLDQKNYIEELNRHLNATVTDLQSRNEALATTNALMKEDLEIARATVVQLQRENERIKHQLEGASRGSGVSLEGKNDKEAKKLARKSMVGCEEVTEDLKQQLIEETALRKQIERELELEVQMKAETEMAAKLLEKDIHEKQDTIVSLRQQLDDIKDINLEMYKKLMDCESSLKSQGDEVSSLQKELQNSKELINNSKQKILEVENSKLQAEKAVEVLSKKASEEEYKSTCLLSDLKIEKEWRQSLQDLIDKEKKVSITLNKKNEDFIKLTEDYEALQSSHIQLISTVEEQERTLEELGAHLSKSKLEVTEIKDASKSQRDAQWVEDKSSKKCNQCNKDFNVARRRHHCRNCGEIFCNACSDNQIKIPAAPKPVRVCDSCHTQLLLRYAST